MICPRNDYCNAKKIPGQNCRGYEACQTYQYYFPQEEEGLGIGAMTIIPGSLEEELNGKTEKYLKD